MNFAFLNIKYIFRGKWLFLCSSICDLLNLLKPRIRRNKGVKNGEIKFIVEHMLNEVGFEFGSDLIQILIINSVFPLKRIGEVVCESCGCGWLNSILFKVFTYNLFILFVLHGAGLLISNGTIHNWKHVGVDYHGKGKAKASIGNFSLIKWSQIPVCTTRQSDDCVIKRISILPNNRKVYDLFVSIRVVNPKLLRFIPTHLDKFNVEIEKEWPNKVAQQY